MIVLKIFQQDQAQLKLLKSIQDMSLAHRVESISPHTKPAMIAYGKKYEGISQIKEGIYEVEKLLEAWYECQCD